MDRYVFAHKYRDKIKRFKEKGEYWQVVNEKSEQVVEESEYHEIKRICLDSGNKLFFKKQYNVIRSCGENKNKHRHREYCLFSYSK
ncbi:MAG: hypothetical protein MTP17_01075 [Candidatus Midichloria sp.]|nr:MAG: hypothetical protein MTP17_01075 [Candidatus Midichloria sp.]